jgi:AraC-like DNA-binding protein
VNVWCAGNAVLVEGRCPVEDPKWTAGPPMTKHRVMFVRHGAFLRRVNGVESFADNTSVLILRPGDELAVAHPLGCGDGVALIEPADELADPLRAGVFSVDDDIDMALRRLVTAARRGTDDLELAERICLLLERLPNAGLDTPGGVTATHRRLTADAAQLLATEGYAVGLGGLADRLDCSPHHLSRTFRRVTGQTLTAYRNRARVREVLGDLQDGGAGNLRELAARYGFADQAHMIRVVRRHAGASPGTLQKVLRA